MRDFGRSDDPAVQAQLDRLSGLSLATGRVNLDTIGSLMERLGNPQDRLPPVFHVAGTNGKGSVCAFLRAMLEADGKRVHVTTSPHLVRYNERIRLAGTLISDERLAQVLGEVFDAAHGLCPSFFEVTIAAGFLEFSRVPADACVIEVGLGGRLDATNILKPQVLAACGIAALGIDHERFLLAPEDAAPTLPMARIAFEKAGIAKRGVPLVVSAPDYGEEEMREIRKAAARTGAILKPLTHEDMLEFGPPDIALIGQHQSHNAGLAAAMLRAQGKLSISEAAIITGPKQAHWPARMQRMASGPLVQTREVWLDGGHNRSAGEAIAAEFEGRRVHLIIGMLAAKDPRALLDPMAGSLASITAVPIEGYETHPPAAFGADASGAGSLGEALAGLPQDDCPVLIAGSLYLAGEALRANDEMPD
jgi:dihydrofolate synthase/folylpolyglutamate synthase